MNPLPIERRYSWKLSLLDLRFSSDSKSVIRKILSKELTVYSPFISIHAILLAFQIPPDNAHLSLLNTSCSCLAYRLGRPFFFLPAFEDFMSAPMKSIKRLSFGRFYIDG